MKSLHHAAFISLLKGRNGCAVGITTKDLIKQSFLFTELKDTNSNEQAIVLTLCVEWLCTLPFRCRQVRGGVKTGPNMA